MKHFWKMTTMSLLLLVVASFALACPAFAFDDCRDGPTISVGIDQPDDLIVAATEAQVQTDDQQATAQHDPTEAVAVICPTSKEPVPRARDVGADTNFAPTALAVANSSLLPVVDRGIRFCPG